MWLVALFVAGCGSAEDRCDAGNEDGIADGLEDGEACAEYELTPRRGDPSYDECYGQAYEVTYDETFAEHCK